MIFAVCKSIRSMEFVSLTMSNLRLNKKLIVVFTTIATAVVALFWVVIESNDTVHRPRSIRRAQPDTPLSRSQSLEHFKIEELEAVLALPVMEPEPPSALLDLTHWNSKVETSIQQLTALFPNSAEVEHLHGLIQLRLKRTKLAEPLLQRCVEMAPSNPKMRIDLAELLLQLGRAEEALQVLHVPTIDAKPMEAQYLEMFGDCQVQMGQIAEAETSFRAALDIAPTLPSIWTKLGKVLLQQNQLAEAKQCATRAIEIDADLAQAWLLLHQLAVLQRETVEAREAFARWTALTKVRPKIDQETSFDEAHSQNMGMVYGSIFRSIATLYLSLGNLPQALTHLDLAIEINPRDTIALAARANQWRRIGDFQRAAELNRLLIRMQPLEAAHYQNLANLCMQLNQPLDAEATLRLACQRLPLNGQLHLALAQFLLYLGKPEEALAPARIAAKHLNSNAAHDILNSVQNAVSNRPVTH